MQFNHPALKAAQKKVKEALQKRDERMWREAYQEAEKAIGMPWHQRGKRQ